jgi:copper chaperone
MKSNRWMPSIMIGVMLLVMVGLMGLFNFMFGSTNPLQMIYSSSATGLSEMWPFMLIFTLGLLLMGGMMFFFYRRMTNNSGHMSKMMDHHHTPKSQIKEKNMNTQTYHIPAISCMHCKMTIERKVGKLPGVTSVKVDVSTKQAVIKFSPPATKVEIEALLAEIGYPSEK